MSAEASIFHVLKECENDKNASRIEKFVEKGKDQRLVKVFKKLRKGTEKKNGMERENEEKRILKESDSNFITLILFCFVYNYLVLKQKM